MLALITRLCDWTVKHARLVLLAGVLCGLWGAFYSVKLYQNLRTNIEELLPASARSVLDLNEVSSRLESTDNLAVIIFSDDPAASRHFVDALAERLQQAPKSVVASIEYRIDKELEFFQKRRPLFMDLADLKQVRRYIEYEREDRNPLKLFDDATLGLDQQKPQLDFKALQKKYEGRVSAYSRFPDGYYASADGKIRIVLVDLPGKISGIEGARRLKAEVAGAVAALQPTQFHPSIRIQYSGGVENVLEEQASLVADLELSTVIVLVLVISALALYYRSVGATVALITSLLIGTFVTFGISYFAVGYLNANTAFLGSIVVGNGINFGIIMLARYFEERRNGLLHHPALQMAMRNTMQATWTAALAAGLAYGSLWLTEFRGFKQFGLIGFVGMVLCWSSSFTLLPAFLTLIDRRWPLLKAGQAPPKLKFFGRLATFIQANAKALSLAFALLTLVSLAGFVAKMNPHVLETNMNNLRDKRSLRSGSGYWSTYVDAVFQRYLAPIVVLAKSRDEASRVGELLKQRKAAEGQESMLAAVYTMDDFQPRNQDAKIEEIKAIQAMLTPAIIKRLKPDERTLVADLMHPESVRTFAENELPYLVRKKFLEKNGSFGNLVLVEPPLSSATWDGDRVVPFIRELRQMADSVRPGMPVAGQLPVSADLIQAITHDGPRATGVAFVAVLLLVLLLFRNWRLSALCLFTLLVGVCWMAGAIFWGGLKINFLNFIALPITFGIGVDYGVNVFQRYQIEGKGSILQVIRHTGGAVGMASLTTIIGYGALLLAGNQALFSFGLLAVIGEITCLTAAVVALPAYLVLRERR